MKPHNKTLLAGTLLFALLAPAVSADKHPNEQAAPTAYIARFKDDCAAAISYTFDDGLRDQYTVALPMLNSVGFKATFFVIPGSTAETPEEAEKRKPGRREWGGISWPELKEIAGQGHEIASHTWSHPNLQKLPAEEVEAQFSKAYEAIKDRVGIPPLTVAFPFNASTPEVAAAARKFHVAYRSYQTGIGEKTTVASLNSWSDKLVKDKKWGIVMAHGISRGYAALTGPEILRAHWTYVKDRKSDIWVDTFSNVARYEKERESANLTVSGKPGSLTCVLDSTLDSLLYNVPLTIVINASGAKSARARREGKELPVRMANGSIYIQAALAPQPITVTWMS